MAAYLHLVPTLDAIIDAVGGGEIMTLSNTILSATAEAVQKHRSPHAGKLTYIWTSGTWIHGENRTDVVSDTSALGTPPAIVAWRPAQEERVLKNPHVNGLVIRPSLLYGRSGSIFSLFFKRAHAEGVVEWPGTPGGRLSLIHADDLAELYLLAAEKAAIAGGKIFDAANDVNESTDAFLQRLVEISGAKAPYRYKEPSNVFEQALSTTIILRPYLGRTLLGWRPRKAGLLDHLDIYYKAWGASEGITDL